MSYKNEFKSLLAELLKETDKTSKKEKVIQIVKTFKLSKKDEFLDQETIDKFLLDLQTALKDFVENGDTASRDSLKLQYVFMSDVIVN